MSTGLPKAPLTTLLPVCDLVVVPGVRVLGALIGLLVLGGTAHWGLAGVGRLEAAAAGIVISASAASEALVSIAVACLPAEATQENR